MSSVAGLCEAGGTTTKKCPGSQTRATEDSRRPLIRPAATFSRKAKDAFTLVEMLVVMVIIGILASLALAALFASQEAARRSRSEGIIGVLNNQMALRWESYRTRRIPVSNVYTALSDANKDKLQMQALLQLTARRQLMRIELPDRWWDIAFDDNEDDGDLVPYTWVPGVDVPLQLAPTFYKESSKAYADPYDGSKGPSWENNIVNGTPIKRNITGWPQVDRQRIDLISRTSLSYAYQRRYQQVLQQRTSRPTNQHQGAECLYMILTTNMGDETTGGGIFNDRDIADTDEDGMPELVDGWGRPISFLRWAPGFRSEMQTGDPVNDHDPFDPRKVDKLAFRLFPLIVSAGPDGVNDDGVNSPIGIENHADPIDAGDTNVNLNDPYAPRPEPNVASGFIFRGERIEESAGIGPNDNIFNQALTVR